jgi:hypothetical protein
MAQLRRLALAAGTQHGNLLCWVPVGLLILAQAALGQTAALRFKYEPGQARVYERQVRSNTTTRTGQQSQHTVTEMTVQHQEIVLEWRAEPPAARILVLESPSPERLVLFQENGQDRLPTVPEESRARPMSPVLAVQARGSRGMLAGPNENVADPMQALETLHNDMQALPTETGKAGDTWTRDVNLGSLKAKVTTKFVGTRTVADTPCAVLEASADVAFTGNLGQHLTVEKMAFETAVALDGSGPVSHTGTITLNVKSDKGEQQAIRTFNERLTKALRLEPANLEKIKADLAYVDKALDQARTDDLDGAVATLDGFLKDNPQSGWAPAVQNLRGAIFQRRLMTQPVPAMRLRLMLRDLQTARDRAAAQGGQGAIEQVDQTLKQIATVNAKTLLEESSDPDPVARDLAAFGLAFLSTDESRKRLAELVKDASAPVRGTAAIGLAIHEKAAEPAVLLGLLNDPDLRTRGAAAILVARTVKKDDAQANQVLPLLLSNARSANAWTRSNSINAAMVVAPAGSPLVAATLIVAYKEETEQGLRPMYLQALKILTGVDAADIGAYEQWSKQHPSPQPVPEPPLASTATGRPAFPTPSGTAPAALPPLILPAPTPAPPAPTGTASAPAPAPPIPLPPILLPTPAPSYPMPTATAPRIPLPAPTRPMPSTTAPKIPLPTPSLPMPATTARKIPLPPPVTAPLPDAKTGA